MADWDGEGLPPAARRRIEEARSHTLKSSLLSVSGAVGVDLAGFHPVTEVMGSAVMNSSGAVFPNCGVGYGYGYGASSGYAPMASSATIASSLSGGQGYYGRASYVDIVNTGWSLAMQRMMAEVSASGADGVIGVKLMRDHLGDGSIEFMALGTALSSGGRTPIQHPFSSHLSGTEFAKLMAGGWMTAELVVEVAVALRHNDYRTAVQLGSFMANVEVEAYSQLIHDARSEARSLLEHAVRKSGADGAIVDDFSVRTFNYEPAEGHVDHVAEVFMTGTTIAQYSKAHRPVSPLKILRLKD